MDDLIENNSIEDLENIFSNLKIKTLYVFREIKKKEDFNQDFILPKSKLSLKKAYLLKDPSLFHFYKGKEMIVVESGSLKNNTLISTNKKISFLKNPFSEKLSFDEQNARSCFQNKINVVFEINLLRGIKKNAYLKQFIFILNLLKIHSVDMVFVSFAKNIDDLVDPLVLFSFLKNFNLQEDTIYRMMSKKF